MKKIIILVLILFNHTVFGGEKCVVNVFNTLCLGGSFKEFTNQYKDLEISNDDKNPNVKIISIRGSTKNTSGIEILNRLNYQNVKFVQLKSFNNKIYDVTVNYTNPKDVEDWVSKKQIDTIMLVGELDSKYGMGDKNPYSDKDYFLIQWKLKNYEISVDCLKQTDCHLEYLLPKIEKTVKSDNGL